MPDSFRKQITAWTVDYHDGRTPSEISVPHAWRQDTPVTAEGPVTYRTSVTLPEQPTKLVFWGVSYHAEVVVDGVHRLTHDGIWDAFEVSLDDLRGRNIEVTVHVTKNGGATFPVRDVASGFLPFVYHTFGGIYGSVELVGVCEPSPGAAPAMPSRMRVEGHKIFVDGRPFYPRGLLHWGWYPEVGHTNAPDETILAEVRAAKELGFNLVKFCLWVPPHRYLEILREEGMEAWLELPLWDPTDEPGHQEVINQELERIVRQYRHHENILIWTVGCELSASTSAEYREYLYRLVKNLTRSPLVKDNSGGAEMYGGDLREFGDFYDFHPYCDTPYYPAVLDSLMPGARTQMPILLGEFNDIDAHRDLAKLSDELPYWLSSLPELNDQGVRWQHDLPSQLPTNRFATHPKANGHKKLMESSRQKALFIRKTVQEAVRAREAISGYVITGWRDTPISNAGLFDDWDRPRYSPNETLPWNGPTVLFLIPTRRPPWVNGGNRPGWIDPFNHFCGQVFWRVGVHAEAGISGGLVWKVTRLSGEVVARGSANEVRACPLESAEVGQIHWRADEPGEYILRVELGDAANEWPIWVVQRADFAACEGWSAHDPRGVVPELTLPGGANCVAFGQLPDSIGSGVLFLLDEGTKPEPFWREAAYEFRNSAFWEAVPFAERWSRLLPVSPDRTVDLDWLASREPGRKVEVLLNRIDVRTYLETPVLVRVTRPEGTLLVTTLRPQGGLGTQPTSLKTCAAGSVLLQSLMRAAIA